MYNTNLVLYERPYLILTSMSFVRLNSRTTSCYREKRYVSTKLVTLMHLIAYIWLYFLPMKLFIWGSGQEQSTASVSCENTYRRNFPRYVYTRIFGQNHPSLVLVVKTRIAETFHDTCILEFLVWMHRAHSLYVSRKLSAVRYVVTIDCFGTSPFIWCLVYLNIHQTQKQALARRLNLRPRQVEVWYQNRRARYRYKLSFVFLAQCLHGNKLRGYSVRTLYLMRSFSLTSCFRKINRNKLKQTEMECEMLKKCFEKLKDENRKLEKEVQQLKETKGKGMLPVYDPMQLQPAANLSLCPFCERITSSVFRRISL